MLVACWSAKGGSGTTVVSAALAMVLARASRAGAVLLDLAGDVPAVLGLPEPTGPGLTDWFAAGPAVPADALARLEVEAGCGVRVLPRGQGCFEDASRAGVLAGLLAGDGRPVVVDCGSVEHEPGRSIAAEADESLLVTRPCFLAVRRAQSVPLHPSGIVLVRERGRSLHRPDIEKLLGAPVRAEVPVDPTVARAVDAGLLAAGLPRRLERALRRAA